MRDSDHGEFLALADSGQRRDPMNIFHDVPARRLDAEDCRTLLASGAMRLERIVSTGHVTPAGQWYDQDDDEWVIVLQGQARLRFDDDPEPLTLSPGDHLVIPAHRRHRVEWTDPEQPTVWLALHYRTAPADQGDHR